jgi:hypothetical protein
LRPYFQKVREDAMLGWALAMGSQWLFIEPIAICLFGSFSLFLKWCTDFESVDQGDKRDKKGPTKASGPSIDANQAGKKE